MGLTLHRGAAFGGADRAALAAWRERGGLLVLRDADVVTRALAAAGGETILGREALTLGGLRRRVRETAGLPDEEPAPSVRVRLALLEALAERVWPGFGASADGPGAVAVLERALTELRAGRVRPRDLDGFPGASPVTADLAVLADAVAGLRLRPDRDWETADAAAGLTAFPPVAMTGFDDVTPPDWALLRGLARVTPVEVALVDVPGHPAYAARTGRRGGWAADAERVIDHPLVAEPGRPAALAALDRGLFADVAGEPTGPEAVRMVEAAGTRGMHRAALEEILAVHRAGIPLAECALVVPRLAEAADDLDRLLAHWGVPRRRSTRLRVLETPLGLALAALLELGGMEVDDPGALDPLLRWLRTPYSGADPDEVDRFEADMRRTGDSTRRATMARWDGEAIRPARALVRASREGLPAQLGALVPSAGRVSPGRATGPASRPWPIAATARRCSSSPASGPSSAATRRPRPTSPVLGAACPRGRSGGCWSTSRSATTTARRAGSRCSTTPACAGGASASSA